MIIVWRLWGETKDQKIDNGDRGHMSDAVDYGIYANEGGGTAIYSSIPLR